MSVRELDPEFYAFARDSVAIAGSAEPSDAIQRRIAASMQILVNSWRMPDNRYCRCQPDSPYGSYLLFLCPKTRLCIVLDVFAPGQVAAIHDHGVWGVFGCLSGQEIERRFEVPAGTNVAPVEVSEELLIPGRIRTTDPEGALFHQVECASDTESISLHVYGDDIGRLTRRRWSPADGRWVPFSSGYSNQAMGCPPYLEQLG